MLERVLALPGLEPGHSFQRNGIKSLRLLRGVWPTAHDVSLIGRRTVALEWSLTPLPGSQVPGAIRTVEGIPIE